MTGTVNIRSEMRAVTWKQAVTWKSGASAPRKASRIDAGFSPSGHTPRHGQQRLYQTAESFLLLFVSVAILVTPAAAKSWRISNFQDTITVNADGSALVSETITLKFDGDFHGIHRTIPVEYPGPNGT